MNVQLISSTNGPLHFNSGYQNDFAGKRLAGSRMFSHVDKAGTLVVQELVTKNYSICYHIFRFFKKITLQRRCHHTGLHVRVMLRGAVSHRISGLGKINLKEGQLAIVFMDSGECLAQFDKNREYQAFDLFFSRSLIEPFANAFPNLNELLRPQGSFIKLLSPPAITATPDELEIIGALLSSPYNKSIAHAFIGDKVRDLLLLLLEQAYEQPSVQVKLSTADIDALHKAKEFIETNFSRHFTIPQLAREAGLNEYKLKAGFRMEFKMSVFDCLIQQRMNKAMEYIVTGEQSVKQIAYMTGYRRLTSFVTAFRKYYGKSPGKIRFNKQ